MLLGYEPSIKVSGHEKDHVDFASDMDIIVKSESSFSTLEKPFGALVGAGLPLFSLAGGLVRKVLYDVLTSFHINRGYRVIETPLIASAELYKVSGHMDYYKDNMFVFTIEDKEFVIKPMNCPHHILIFANVLQKYRTKVNLPFRTFELGRVHRYEPSGSLYGLLRVRGFTQDDAHIFVSQEQVKDEMVKVFEEIRELYENVFHLPVNMHTIKLRLSFANLEEVGKYYAGTHEEWTSIQEFMRGVAEEIRDKYGIEYYEGVGEAVFYGPKLDVVTRLGDLGEWQIGTIQFDFNLPRRFRLVDLVERIYGSDMQIHMIHRALLGSIERFLGLYLEYTGGRLPIVLNPIQVLIVRIYTGKDDIDRKIAENADVVYERLKKAQVRAARVDADKVTLSATIRDLESRVKPSVYVFIGEREINEMSVNIRYYDIENKKHISIKEKNNDLTSTVEHIIDRLEEKTRNVLNARFRIYEDLEYMV